MNTDVATAPVGQQESTAPLVGSSALGNAPDTSVGSNGGPSASGGGPEGERSAEDKRSPKRHVLCFDGTSNEYRGDGTDTNILKIFSVLARRDPDQYHYYQPGIGTYVIDQALARTDWLASIRAPVSKMKDLMFGTTISEHVLGGYKFLMRYWQEGDDIIIIGFSRGAYTARVFAEMLDRIGLLPHGNEENVDSAWRFFRDWQLWKGSSHPKKVNALWERLGLGSDEERKKNSAATEKKVEDLLGNVDVWKRRAMIIGCDADHDEEPLEHYTFWEELTGRSRKDWKRRNNNRYYLLKMEGYKSTFCRDVGQIRFLGLFDTVSSVPSFDNAWMGHAAFPYGARTLARKVCHAVSIDERRIYFRPDLAYQKAHGLDVDDFRYFGGGNQEQQVDEVWFAGDHCDVGGGWRRDGGHPRNSVIPLVWMLRAARQAGVAFDDKRLRILMASEGVFFDWSLPMPTPAFAPAAANGKKKEQKRPTVASDDDEALLERFGLGAIHDELTSAFWAFAQMFPILRMELRQDSWEAVRRWGFKKPRDMPPGPTLRIHSSVFERLKAGSYEPRNLPTSGGNKKKFVFNENDWELVPRTETLDSYDQVYRMKQEGEAGASSA